MTQHAIDRAAERCDLEISGEDLKAAVEDIQAGRSLLLRKGARERGGGVPREWHLVSLGGRDTRVIYSPLTELIITVLPRWGFVMKTQPPRRVAKARRQTRREANREIEE
jgi:hypothetical protein